MTYSLGNVTFDSKKAIAKEFKSILHHSDIGEVDAMHHHFLLDLLKMHPDAKQKIGIGVEYFKIVIRPYWKTRGMDAVRVDGSQIDFSYKLCLSGKRRTPREQFNKAARKAIEPSMYEFKARMFGTAQDVMRCPETDKPLDWWNSAADHYPIAFDDIANDFLGNRGARPDDYEYDTTSAGTSFRDKRVAKRFKGYHDSIAILRLVHNRYNSQAGKHREARLPEGVKGKRPSMRGKPKQGRLF